MGEAFFEKGFGKKAMLWGALAQSIPDIDFIAGLWMPPAAALLAHRGFTHSILFALLIVPALALAAGKVHRLRNIAFRTWLLFFGTQVLLHLFIDVFNNYGIGWFEPFSHTRYSFNILYVADPFFSLWPGMALFMLIFLNRFSVRRWFWWRFGLIIPFFYLAYCSLNKIIIDREVKSAFEKQGISQQRYFTTPAPLQNWLWYVVAGTDSGYYVGFRSLFDRVKEINFSYFPRNDSLLQPLRGEEELARLIRFSKQFYTVEKWHDTLVFNDLRFGQIIGWQPPTGKFVFYYYLQYPGANAMLVQRGRFAGWNRRTVKQFVRRIGGN